MIVIGIGVVGILLMKGPVSLSGDGDAAPGTGAPPPAPTPTGPPPALITSLPPGAPGSASSTTFGSVPLSQPGPSGVASSAPPPGPRPTHAVVVARDPFTSGTAAIDDVVDTTSPADPDAAENPGVDPAGTVPGSGGGGRAGGASTGPPATPVTDPPDVTAPAPTTTTLAPAIQGAASPTGGYWIVLDDGTVFAADPAHWFGDLRTVVLNQPIVAIVPSVSGRGYVLVASDGGVFAFGDAPYSGSVPDSLSRSPDGLARTCYLAPPTTAPPETTAPTQTTTSRPPCTVSTGP